MTKDEFKQLFNSHISLDQNIVTTALKQLKLPAQLERELILAFNIFMKQECITLFKNDVITLSEYLIAFTKCFSTTFKVNPHDLWRYLDVNQVRSEQEKNWDAGLHVCMKSSNSPSA